ncbi:type II toxin-antitoxin system VapC family toxin [Nevskia soli]|uniref:type II toxin-antitoxin system VapC family toxin n=1 Tax=Nevskia soli TaxID=418856 RepID=UPI0015D8859F|nr:type II toxin-antitoxin system VapC family toxin [Nevskia soli]
MSGYLLDTNCVSEAVKLRPDPQVADWIESVDESLLFLSVMTLGEIRKGLANLEQGKRRTQLETWLEIDLRDRFHKRILGIDRAIADRWGALTGEAKRRGQTVAVVDGILAATALHYNLTVVSRNANDFARAQVAVLNPWSQ